MKHAIPRSDLATQKCQDLGVYGAGLIVALGFIFSAFITPVTTTQHVAPDLSGTGEQFNWMLMGIALALAVAVASVSMMAQQVTSALFEMQMEARVAAKLRADDQPRS
jgi:hypothetical protein